MRVAYLGPAGTFTEDALGEAWAGGELRAAAHGDDPRRDPRRRARRGGPGAGPDRELDRGLGAAAPSTPSPSRPTAVTIVGEHDFRVRVHLIAREGVELERGRGGALPPAAARPVRPLPARATLPGVELRSVSSTAAAVRMVSESTRPWAALGGARGGRALRLRAAARGGRGRERQRHPLPLDRAGRDRGRRRRARGRPRWSSPSSARTTPGRWSTPSPSSPRRGINLTRIESRPLRQELGRYMFFFDLEGGCDDEPVAAAIARAADQGRIGPHPRLLPARLSGPPTDAAAARSSRAGQPGAVPTIRGQHGTGPCTQRDVRADQRLHAATRRRAAAEGKGRAARAPRRAPRCTPST